mgnify:CR=1 FL=1
MNLSDETLQLIKSIKDKYAADGQDFNSYLEGLLHNNYLDYWDYIKLDVLPNLQYPRTGFPDEKIFIIYHQITELYFNLCLHEIEQLRGDYLENDSFSKRMKRLVNYFKALTNSFSVMKEGMDRNQFISFRMALLPASGFQSAQYRKIEIASTPFTNLVYHVKRDELKSKGIAKQFEEIYWKRGATLANTGKKTLTLKRFEQKYTDELIENAEALKGLTIYDLYLDYLNQNGQDEELKKNLKEYDKLVNILWPGVHYKTADRYLGHDAKGTGGTNWREYLPPEFQKRIFFPELYSENELKNWTKI